MSRRALSLATTLVAFGGAAPALADSTITQTLQPGESLRSSTDPAPTPANPVIVTATTAEASRPDGSGCRTNCSQGPADVTITLKDEHSRANGPGIEGPSGLDFLGPQVDIKTTHQFPNIAKVVFEVDGSLIRPDFNSDRGQFSYWAVGPNDVGERMNIGFTPAGAVDETRSGALAEKLPDGDYRLTVTQAFGLSFDLFQESWFMFGYGLGDDLTDTLRKGMPVWMKTNYKASEEWKVTVSSAVARVLKLKSTVIGRASFPRPGGKNRRIPFIAAARKALRKYSRIRVTLSLRAKGPGGKVEKDSRSVELERPRSELG